jgi:hypothetical protein
MQHKRTMNVHHYNRFVKREPRKLFLNIAFFLASLIFAISASAQRPSVCYNDATGPTSQLATPSFAGTLPFPTNGKECTAHQYPSAVNIFNSYFKKQQNYSPANPTILPSTVAKKIKIRFVVLDTDPNGPKKNYRASDNATLTQFVTRTNQLLAQLSAPTNPQTSVCGGCYQPDSRIKLELTGIEYLQDPFLQYDVYGTTQQTSGFVASGKYKDSILNIYFVYNPYVTSADPNTGIVYLVGGAWAKFPVNFGSLDPPSSFIVLRNYFATGADLVNSEPRRLIHELGHVLGLYHVFPNKDVNGNYINTDEPGVGSDDYLSDIFGATGQNYPLPTVTNDYMDAIATTSSYMSPQQLGREHRSLFLSSARNYAYPVEQPQTHPWVITQNQTWNFPIRLFQNLRINTGATLTIRCQVEMPDKSNIIIEPGGKLIVDGGILTSYHSRIGWGGIQVKGQSNFPSKPEYQGVLEMKNGAVIQNAWEGIWNYSPENYFTEGAGGIVRVTTGSKFYNCNKAADIGSYENYSYTYASTCNCLFNDVDFLIDSQSPFVFQYGQKGYEYFTTERIKTGMQIVNCRFKNTIPYNQQIQHDRGAAVRLFETGMLISGTSFEGFMEGVRLHGYTGSSRPLTLLNNKFNHITRNITVAASGFSSIRGNLITNIINSDTSMFVQPGWGIFLDNSKGVYVGCGNTISGITDYVQSPSFELFDRRGLVIQDTRSFGGTATDNTFNDIAVGTQTQRDNPLFNIFCNTYSKNKAAWKVNPLSANYPFHDQGTGCTAALIRAGNVFNNNTKDIVNYTTTFWRYYAFGPVISQIPLQNVNFNGVNSCYALGGGQQDPNSLCNGVSRGPRPNISVCNTLQASTSLLQNLIKDYRVFSTAGLKLDADAIMLFQQVVSTYYDLDDEPGLVTFLESENDDNARRLLIPLYIGQSRFSDAQTTIGNLQIDPNEKEGYANYYNVLINLKANNRNIENLYDDERAQISNIAHDELEVSAFAKSLLDKIGAEPWIHIVEDAPTVLLNTHRKGSVATTTASRLGAAVPNPAGNHTAVNVFIANTDADRTPVLLLRNAIGAVLAQHKLEVGNNTVDLSTGSYPAGYYFYTLQIDGRNFDTRKLILIK